MRRISRLINRVRRRIEVIFKNTDPAPFLSMATFLYGFSLAYGGLMAIRARLYQREIFSANTLPCRVISIGNLVAGGTGKTPMTLYVAGVLKASGFRVVVASRGYRGRRERSGGVVSDGVSLMMTAAEAGDEPFLMARILPGIPVIVGKDRHKAGMCAIRLFDPDVIVLDDAFQHLRLKRDLDLVLLDDGAPLGNGWLLPRGALREPPSALRRAGAIVYTRHRADSGRRDKAPRPLPGRPVFRVSHRPVIRTMGGSVNRVFLTDTRDFALLAGKRVVAFSGLAENEQFFDSLERIECKIVRRYGFSDHHAYQRSQIEEILASARSLGTDFIVTSFKDAVKIESIEPRLPGLVVVDVTIDFGIASGRFRDFLLQSLFPASQLSAIEYKKN